MPRCFNSETMKSALDKLNVSLMSDVPVELSAAPVTLTDKSYFFATLANSSRLSFCETSVRRAVLRVKRNIQGAETAIRNMIQSHEIMPFSLHEFIRCKGIRILLVLVLILIVVVNVCRIKRGYSVPMSVFQSRTQ